MDAELVGASAWAALGAVDDRCSLWAIALQQARSALQLALRRACGHSGNILWTGVASGATSGRIGDHPCFGRYAVVALVAMIGLDVMAGWVTIKLPRMVSE